MTSFPSPNGPARGGQLDVRGALLVTGTTSDAGKSTLVTGLCRWLHRRGVRVAPFKAQNMSNNSAVTPEGGEIGRAQALQAAACGLEPSVRFNPVLLKPGSEGTSQVVMLGRPVGNVGADDYQKLRAELTGTVFDTLAQLRRDYDVVLCEGAGSPTEINLRAGDLVNMGLARAARLPTLVVADIDRGGALAALFGTTALLSPEDQALIAGFVVNKFRGDVGLLQPGLDMLTALTGRPFHGVLPYEHDLWLDSEDSLGYTDGRVLGRPGNPYGTGIMRVAVVRLPGISNATDVEALAVEPGVQVRLTTSPVEVHDADLVVLPGTRSTVADLAWLRARGLADAVRDHVTAGRPLLGICGGYQMLAETITDTVESRQGTVPGLGLLPSTVRFEPDKILARPTGTGLGAPVGGYEIHHGVALVRYADPRTSNTSGSRCVPLLELPDGTIEGCRAGPVFGTHWHGAFEHDEFRRRFLTEAARLAGRHGFRVAPDTSLSAVRTASLDRLADLVEQHLDTGALLRLIESGPPAGLPTLPPGAPAIASSASDAPIRRSPPGVQETPHHTVADLVGAVIEGTDPGTMPSIPLHPPAARPAETMLAGRSVVESFASLVDEILARPARLGTVRLVAVDGRAGSGKTTFAGRLVDTLTGRVSSVGLLHTDDLLQGWLDPVTFWPRLEEWVLAPLRRGDPARYRRFNWFTGHFGDSWELLGSPDVLVLEGVSCARSVVRPELTASILVQAPRQLRFDRGMRRDGTAVRADWNRWMLDEDEHFDADRTVGHVDVVVDASSTVPHGPEREYVRIRALPR